MNSSPPFSFTAAYAYIIGLLTTDGSLSKDKRHIDFTSKDLQLIKTFKNCLSLRNKIGSKSNSIDSRKKYHHIQFGNVAFYRWLLRIGLKPNKTRNLGPLKIPRKYFRDFLRGHLDGDGSIVTYLDYSRSYKKKKYCYQRIYLTFYSSSKRHLRWLQSKMKELCACKNPGSFLGWKDTKRGRKVTLWKLRFSKNDSLKLLAWIYYAPNLPCLHRKRKIAERYLGAKII